MALTIKTRLGSQLTQKTRPTKIGDHSFDSLPLAHSLCPTCGSHLQKTTFQWQSRLAGIKFDPTDVELMGHLEAKVNDKGVPRHPQIDDFIPTLTEEDGICGMHPENLPGIIKDGSSRHYFHRPAKAYNTGTRKRRKIEGGHQETRWHKTGKTRPVMDAKATLGCKKIMVLYISKGRGRQTKPVKTNWVMHQYHLGKDVDEKEGQWVVSKVFYQISPRQCNSRSLLESASGVENACDHEGPEGSCGIEVSGEQGRWPAESDCPGMQAASAVKPSRNSTGTAEPGSSEKLSARKKLNLLPSVKCREQRLSRQHSLIETSPTLQWLQTASLASDLLLANEAALCESDVGSSQEPPEYDLFEDAVSSQRLPQGTGSKLRSDLGCESKRNRKWSGAPLRDESEGLGLFSLGDAFDAGEIAGALDGPKKLPNQDAPGPLPDSDEPCVGFMEHLLCSPAEDQYQLLFVEEEKPVRVDSPVETAGESAGECGGHNRQSTVVDEGLEHGSRGDDTFSSQLLLTSQDFKDFNGYILDQAFDSEKQEIEVLEKARCAEKMSSETRAKTRRNAGSAVLAPCAKKMATRSCTRSGK